MNNTSRSRASSAGYTAITVAMVISLVASLVFGMLLFIGSPNGPYSLDIAFGLSVATLLCIVVTILARRAAPSLQDRSGDRE